MGVTVKIFREGQLIVASDLNSYIVIDKEFGVAEEFQKFHVDTPKKDGGRKKKLKYGWMHDEHGNVIEPSDKQPKSKLKPRSLDAVFIAPSFQQARHYAIALNYDLRNVILCTQYNYEQKLRGITPDEDLHVHLCGSWIVDNEDELDVDTYYDLQDVIDFLESRNFSFERVGKIGKANPG